MSIIEFLRFILKGRGLYPSFLVISAFSITFILSCVFIYQLFLLLLGVKYKNKKFIRGLTKKTDNNKNQK